MIVKHRDSVLALTADDKLYEWKDEEPIMPKLVVESVAKLSFCPRYGEPTILTHDGRILAALKHDEGFRDITAAVSEALEVSTDLIQDIQVYGGVITAITHNRISFSNLYFFRASETVCYRGQPHSIIFPHRINLTSFGYTHGYVRTDDNTLHSLGYLQPHYRTLPKVHYSPEPGRVTAFGIIPTDNVGGISQIICKLHYSFLIMDDGTVHARGLEQIPEYECMRANEPFVQIKFPVGIRIAKIVAKRSHIFYITTEGLCYYSYSCVRQAVSPYSPNHPVLIKALADNVVQDVFVTKSEVTIWYDDSRLCVLHVSLRSWWSKNNGSPIDSAYIDGTCKPIPLTFPNDECIVAVMQASHGIYFTTDQGSVYRHDPSMEVFSPERITFFDDNPVAIESTAARIGSGRSCLDDAQ